MNLMYYVWFPNLVYECTQLIDLSFVVISYKFNVFLDDFSFKKNDINFYMLHTDLIWNISCTTPLKDQSKTIDTLKRIFQK